MTIKELVNKYELSQSDCWELKRGGKSIWILSHDTCERIATIENIVIENIQCLSSEIDFCRLLIYASKDGVKSITIGEASAGNCMSNYYGAMAEKRGKDRAILKLINAYEYNIYSDSESDDFKNKGGNNGV